MSEEQQKTVATVVKSTNVTLRVFRTSKGNIELYVHNIPRDKFEEIAKITNKTVARFAHATWIDFAKARDKSQVTLLLR